MTFKISIKEVCEAVVEIEANNYYEALERVEFDYWANPMITCLNRKTQHLNKTKAPLLEGL